MPHRCCLSLSARSSHHTTRGKEGFFSAPCGVECQCWGLEELKVFASTLTDCAGTYMIYVVVLRGKFLTARRRSTFFVAVDSSQIVNAFFVVSENKRGLKLTIGKTGFFFGVAGWIAHVWRRLLRLIWNRPNCPERLSSELTFFNLDLHLLSFLLQNKTDNWMLTRPMTGC